MSKLDPLVEYLPAPTVYFVLGGLVNGETGVRALTAGVGEQQPDGWYVVPVGEADGIGPISSRQEAERIADRLVNGGRRWFALGSDQGEIREIFETDESPFLSEDTIVSVSPPDDRGRRTYECECYYENTEHWSLTTTAPLPIALEVCRVALATDAALN